LWDVHLDRTQAMTLLKELVANDLVEPSYVSIGERSPNNYQLQIKCYNKTEIQKFAKNNNLAIEEDKEEKFLFIYET